MISIDPHMKRCVYYLIIGPVRSGTTAAHLMIKGHPQVAALNDEVRLERMLVKGISNFTYDNNTAEENAKSARLSYEFLAKLNASNNSRACGVKCAVSNSASIERCLPIIFEKLRHVRIITTIRDDILAQYASWQRAQATGNWHSWVEGKKNSARYKLRVDPVKYSRYYLEAKNIVGLLRTLKDSNLYLEISYEKEICQSIDYSRKVFEFLEIDCIAPVWFNSQKVAKPVREYVINYDEIKALESEIEASGRPLIDSTGEESLQKRIKNRLHKIAKSFSS